MTCLSWLVVSPTTPLHSIKISNNYNSVIRTCVLGTYVSLIQNTNLEWLYKLNSIEFVNIIIIINTNPCNFCKFQTHSHLKPEVAGQPPEPPHNLDAFMLLYLLLVCLIVVYMPMSSLSLVTSALASVTTPCSW